MSPLKVIKSLALGRTKDGLVIPNFPGYFLIAAILVSGWFLYQVFEPFVTILIFAGILGTAFHPLYKRIVQLLKNRSKLAAVLTCLLILVLIVVPLLIFILLLGRQAFDTYAFVQREVQSGFLDPYIKWHKGGVLYDSLGMVREQLGTFVNLDSIDLKSGITDSAKTITTFVARQSAAILSGLGELLLGFFIMFFALYYFFKDGDLIVKKLMMISPLPTEYEHELFRKFKEISLATLYGIFLTSIVQGIICGIGFTIVGIPNALFWGTATAVFSLVPVIGTAIIWLPAGLMLLMSGNFVGGIFLLLWGLLIVSTVDNFLRAFLIGGKTNTNQLLTFLAVFGGIGVFGIVGVIFGPLILNLFSTFLHIYELEYNHLLHNGKPQK